jgi:hypothetical protein
VPLRKSVAYLFRYRDVAQQSNARYLNALAHVDDPPPGLRGLDTITTRKSPAAGRPVKAFNPVARSDSQLFVALMSGEHAVHGFANRDLRAKPRATFVRTRNRRVPRPAASSTASTFTGWSQRSPVRAAGASPPWPSGHGRFSPTPPAPLSRVLRRGGMKRSEKFIAKNKEPTTEESMLRCRLRMPLSRAGSLGSRGGCHVGCAPGAPGVAGVRVWYLMSR